jgi:hypothetical protein
MDVLSLVVPAIPVREFGTGGDLLLGLLVVAGLVVAIALLMLFARADGRGRHAH